MENKTLEAAAAAAGDEREDGAHVAARAAALGDEGAAAWRTRPDPFEEVWATEIEPLLVADKEGKLEAKTIFAELCRKKPGVFESGQLRTLQRRVREWRAERGPDKEVYFPQEHVPGRMASMDFTRATELGVTIAGSAVRAHVLRVRARLQRLAVRAACVRRDLRGARRGACRGRCGRSVGCPSGCGRTTSRRRRTSWRRRAGAG